MIDTILLATKLVGLALTVVFGIVGVTHQSTDEKNGLTKWGRLVVVGIVVSAFVSAMAEILTLVKEQESAQITAQKTLDEVRRSQRILSDVERSLHPIKDLEVSFEIEIPDHPELAEYRKRLRAEIPLLFQAEKADPLAILKWNAFTGVTGVGNTPEVIVIRPQSRLLPNSSPAEHVAKELMDAAFLSLDIFKRPIEPSAYKGWGPILNHDPHADLSIHVASDFLGMNIGLVGPAERGSPYTTITYRLKDEQLLIVAVNLPSDSKKWISKGTITAVEDLAGAEVFVRPAKRGSSDPKSTPAEKSALEAVLRQLVVRSVSFDMADGRKISLTTPTSKTADFEGYPIYAYKVQPQ